MTNSTWCVYHSAGDYSYLPGFKHTKDKVEDNEDYLELVFSYNSPSYKLKAKNGQKIDFNNIIPR